MNFKNKDHFTAHQTDDNIKSWFTNKTIFDLALTNPWKYSVKSPKKKSFLFFYLLLRENMFFRVLLKNRITSPAARSIMLFVCLYPIFISLHAFQLDIYHVICIITIFFLLPLLLLGVNKKQYGKWVYWIKLGGLWKEIYALTVLPSFLVSIVLLMCFLRSVTARLLHEDVSMTLVTKLFHVMPANEIESFN